MGDTWEVDVEDVFSLSTGALAITGDHRGAHIMTGQSAELVDAEATINVAAVEVEIHHPPEKVALLLRGVDRKQVRIGQVLRGPVAPGS